MIPGISTGGGGFSGSSSAGLNDYSTVRQDGTNYFSFGPSNGISSTTFLILGGIALFLLLRKGKI